MNTTSILEKELLRLIEENGDSWCCTVYRDINNQNTFMVHLLEQDGKSTVHCYMKKLQVRLAEQLGYFPQLSHNSPTDGNILIWMDDSGPKVSEKCCKETFIMLYEYWKTNEYTGSYTAAFTMLSTVEDRLCESIVDKLSPDEEFVDQLIRIEYGS